MDYKFIMGYNANIFLLMPKSLWDVDALAFITAHETNTGLPMGIVQKNAVNNLYKGLKGIGTPNGSALLTQFISSGSRIWPLCPTDNSTASSTAYNIELVSKSVLGTFNNFVSGDFTPQGVIGGSSKFFSTGNAPSSYPLNDILTLMYTRNVATGTFFSFGATNASNANRLSLATRTIGGQEFSFQVNDNTFTNVSSSLANNKGLIGVQRSSSGTKELWLNGSLINSTSMASSARTNYHMYFHALNNVGTASSFYDKQLAMYLFGLPALTSNEHIDLAFVIQNYQTEVITGGRQV